MKTRWIISIVILAFAFVFSFNLIAIPRGLHLMNFLVPAHMQGMADWKWINFMVNKHLSVFIFRHTGKLCDAPHYQDGELIRGQNLTIGLLVSALGEFNEYRHEILEELDYVLAKCDPNIINADQPLSPLHAAILHKEIEGANHLLAAGANPALVITRPGKPIDGMNALQLAQHLESKATDLNVKKAYGEIAELVRQHNAKHLQ